MARSTRQFALTLSDERYRAVMAVVERWRNRPQPSYNLNHRNCVHFVAELARDGRAARRGGPAADEAAALLPAACAQPQSPAPGRALAPDRTRLGIGARPFQLCRYVSGLATARGGGGPRPWPRVLPLNRRPEQRAVPRCLPASARCASPRRRPQPVAPTREEIAAAAARADRGADRAADRRRRRSSGRPARSTGPNIRISASPCATSSSTICAG